MEEIATQPRLTIRRVLIANRGEIVSRILRTLATMNIEGIVIFTADDADKPYLKEAFASYQLNGNSLLETYLNQELIIQLAKISGSDAIHPGYGFLSENADFAQKCLDTGLIWIGPHPKVMRKMADKLAARALAQTIGIPVIKAEFENTTSLLSVQDLQFPILLKAAAGGGGRGMRIVEDQSEFQTQWTLAAKEAQLAFGDPTLFAETYIKEARHIEVQILGDKMNTVIHTYERECSIQRRYQKIVEECPSPSISPKTREQITQAAVALAKAAQYDNAGTVEFLVDQNENFYFIETNARIQVEHPVTEAVTGIDLIEEQIRIANGLPLRYQQSDIKIIGHAIECRICAEDPKNGFNPAPGKLIYYQKPEGQGIRIDDGIESGNKISADYDSLLAKLITKAPNRSAALTLAKKALTRTIIQGIPTNIPYLIAVLNHPEITAGNYPTAFINKHHKELVDTIEYQVNNGLENIIIGAYSHIKTQIRETGLPPKKGNPWTQLGAWRSFYFNSINMNEKAFSVEVMGTRAGLLRFRTNGVFTETELNSFKGKQVSFRQNNQEYGVLWTENNGTFHLSHEGHTICISELRLHPHDNGYSNGNSKGKNKLTCGSIGAPLPGRISRIMVQPGDEVTEGQTMIIIESMKTENQVQAVCDGTVEDIKVNEGQQVKMKDLLIKLKVK